MQPHDAAGLAVSPVGLHHLPAEGEPAAPVGLDENAPLVTVAVGPHYVDVLDPV